MEKKLIKLTILLFIIILASSMFYFYKNKNKKIIILEVNNDSYFNITFINLLNNDSINLGEYKTKNEQVEINMDNINFDEESLGQYLIILENKNQFGVGLFSSFRSEILDSPNQEINQSIKQIYKDRYLTKVDIHFYNKVAKNNIKINVDLKKIELKAFYNEDECIEEERGAFISSGYDFLGNEIGSIFMYNDKFTMGMSSPKCSIDYLGLNVINDFMVAEIAIDNDKKSFNFVVPVEWILSFVTNRDYKSDEFTSYQIVDKDIELKLEYYKANTK